MKKILTLTMALICGAAMAQTVTNNIQASAKLNSSCQINAPTNFSFGQYNPAESDHLYISSKISILCNKETSYYSYIYSTHATDETNGYGRGQIMYLNGNTGSPFKLVYQIQVENKPWALEGYYYLSGQLNDGREKDIGTGEWKDYSLKFRLLKGQYIRPGNYTVNTGMALVF